MKNEGKSYGIGRIGNLNQSMNLQDLCEHVKAIFNVSKLRVTGDLTKKVKKVAILGGSGEKYIDDAKQMGADVYITGDMTFHTAQVAWQMGLSVIDPGHYIEKVMKKATKQYLDQKLHGENVEVIESEVNTDPFHFV
jgi:dinuclear metal center YbgI/SA1388 family protein